MILTGPEIQREIETGKIRITPFNHQRVTTNSYDLSLGKTYIKYTSFPIDTKVPPKYEEKEIPATGMLLNAGDFILCSTAEMIGSDYYVPIIHAKSGIARLGLFVHVTADLIDIGAHVHSTLQLYATCPIVIYPDMLIGQVSFWRPQGEVELYNGKYQHSTKPMPSMIYKDIK
jgi:dCTP deaminase